ncbi:aminotransferase class IV [Limnovirga soli]|uniref:branched-chain-amino-acid transaminase n=1 Tax=Limnovirga soli TaxID=2656915 RepID=A0A8J8FG33_9BACT|nr:aminotransferase class IV [Limnovirga soli]NNV54459.1 aminotransferase IV [Limnovirga soli]
MQQPYNPKNENIQVFVGGKLYHRNEAKVSVFDSSVQGGDAVWEGLRVYDGKIFKLDNHIDRLHASAKTLAFTDIPDKTYIKDAIKQTLAANSMFTDTHIRLTLTRGEKVTSGMDPRLNQKGSCLIVLAEFKPPVFDNAKGIKLITSHMRRNSPMHLDSKIHHNNLLNNILAKIEANYCGADAAIMLDNLGFVSETNDCNIFMVKKGTLLTPHADACLTGITRETVLVLAETLGIKAIERNISISEFYNADEVFITGTMGELTPVYEIDGRIIENKNNSDLRGILYKAFKALTATDGEPI